jgi:hypothetical protein
MKPSAEVTELRRLVGKFALLFAFVYLLALIVGVIRLVQTHSLPLVNVSVLVTPGAAFVPAIVYAVRLHRTSDPQLMKTLWRHCAVYAVAGLAVLITGLIMLGQVKNP